MASVQMCIRDRRQGVRVAAHRIGADVMAFPLRVNPIADIAFRTAFTAVLFALRHLVNVLSIGMLTLSYACLLYTSSA